MGCQHLMVAVAVRPWRGDQGGEILEATRELDTDDLADLVADLPKSITREVLKSLDAQRRARLEQALSYPEDSAGAGS